MPIPHGKIAMVMVYKVHNELKCSCPRFDGEDIDLTNQERSRLRLATQFLRNLFSLRVNKGEEYLYKITQSLVTHLVDYPNCVAVEKRLSDKIDAAERHLNSRIDNLYLNLLNKS